MKVHLALFRLRILHKVDNSLLEKTDNGFGVHTRVDAASKPSAMPTTQLLSASVT